MNDVMPNLAIITALIPCDVIAPQGNTEPLHDSAGTEASQLDNDPHRRRLSTMQWQPTAFPMFFSGVGGTCSHMRMVEKETGRRSEHRGRF